VISALGEIVEEAVELVGHVGVIERDGMREVRPRWDVRAG
jgi:hypothetical protein